MQPVKLTWDKVDQIEKAAKAAGGLNPDGSWVSANRYAHPDLMAGIAEIFSTDLPELRAMNGLFPPSLDETVVRCMKQSGFKTLNLSLGSADRDQLRRFHRPNVQGAFDQSLELAAQESPSCLYPGVFL